ncbi:MAG: serine/threonine-protein kinase [Phycisphaerales bacterium]|nr:serine/threonine-protein kinase [Phycisphaerales bacterium]
MAESHMDSGSGWYHRPDALLNELQRGRLKSNRQPDMNGYDDFREIGGGGQGDVYSAFHRSMKRHVAIKVLRDRAFASEAGRLRFEREIDLIAGLQHPNIVRVYDRGLTSDGKHYFSMEYIDGVSLGDHLTRKTTPNTTDLLHLFIEICAAVGFAHQKGVIHRDLNPSNILIDTDGKPHVLDFGLAKTAEPTDGAAVTVTGEFMGTLAFASPEQLSGDPSQIDIRTDVYSLGVILYQMLTGRRPFSTSAPMADVIKAITETEPLAPSRAYRQNGTPESRYRPISKRYADELDTIVLKAMAKSPDRRYQSVAALQEDIERVLSGRAIEAKRDSGGYLFKKFVQRHKAAVTIGLALLVLVLGLNAAVSMTYRQQAEKEKRLRVFWEDTLGSVGPPTEGRVVTLAEVLDETNHWIEVAASDDPDLEASLRTTIGNSYRSLGDYDKAEKQLRLALEMRRDRFGDEHADVARGLNALALLNRNRGDHAEAERLFQEALAMRRRLLGKNHLDVAQVLQNMAVSRVQQGRLDEAEPLFREALAIRRSHWGDRHADVAMCLYQLGALEGLRGDHDAAETLHRDALRTRRETLHPEHPDIARSLLALGELLSQTEEAESAEPHLRECVNIMRRIVSEDHWRFAEAESALGACMTTLKQFAEAEEMLVRSHSVLENARGERDELTLQSAARLIQLYEAWGKPALARQYR